MVAQSTSLNLVIALTLAIYKVNPELQNQKESVMYYVNTDAGWFSLKTFYI